MDTNVETAGGAARLPPKTSWKHLLAFSKRQHVLVLLSAVVTAGVVAAGKTLYAILIGKIFQVVSNVGAQKLDSSDAVAQVSKWCICLCYLGVAMWMFNTLNMMLWVLSGELRAKTVRVSLFRSLLKKDMHWFDLRKSDLATLVIRIET